MINCKVCRQEISKEAKKCPKCGQPNVQINTISSIITIAAVIIFAWYFFGGGLHNQVAAKFVKDYNIAARQGDPIQMCVQAGLVSAGYLQANDEANYRKWKSKQKADCAAAGL